MQELGHAAPDFGVGEAHQHVQRGGRQVPGLHHRNAGGQQALAAFRRVHDAGQHDAVGPAADDGLQQRVLARIDVAALAEHELVAAFGQSASERLHGLQEHGAGDGRNDRRHQPAARGGQPPGQAVRDIAGTRDGIRHLLQHLGRNLPWRVQGARGGDGRHASQLGHVVQRDRTTAPAGAAKWRAVLAHGADSRRTIALPCFALRRPSAPLWCSASARSARDVTLARCL